MQTQMRPAKGGDEDSTTSTVRSDNAAGAVLRKSWNIQKIEMNYNYSMENLHV
jgi:hypothetical protein